MSPTKEQVAGAVERLTADLAETCPEGSRFANALVGKRDLRTLLQAYASETAENERLGRLGRAIERERDELAESNLQLREERSAAERSLGEALEGLGLLIARINQSPAGVWFLDCEDPEAVVCTASDIYGRLKGEPQAGEPGK